MKATSFAQGSSLMSHERLIVPSIHELCYLYDTSINSKNDCTMNFSPSKNEKCTSFFILFFYLFFQTYQMKLWDRRDMSVSSGRLHPYLYLPDEYYYGKSIRKRFYRVMSHAVPPRSSTVLDSIYFTRKSPFYYRSFILDSVVIWVSNVIERKFEL